MSEILAAESMLDWALRYIRLGWAVFPLAIQGKIPILSRESGGRGCEDATLNEAKVREWWTKWPQANIGVATGHRFFALDEDPANGGTESLQHLLHAHGPLPDTIQQVTGAGGVHYLFRQPDFPVRNSANYIGPGLDIRGHHGYIVAAPSIHPLTRKAYFWDGASEIENQNLANAPDWLLDRLKRHSNRQPDAASPSPAPPIANQIPKGQRHNTLVSIAGSMRRRGLSPDEIFAALSAVNSNRCAEPYDSAHIRKIADSTLQWQPDERYNVFRLKPSPPDRAAPPVTESDALPLTAADVEAAVDEAIAKNDLVAAVRLAPEVSQLRAEARVVILVKLKQHFKREFPEEEFKRAVRAAEAERKKDAKVLPIDGGRAGDGEPPRPPFGGGENGDGTPDLTWQPLTDSGNGERIVALFGKDIRYCIEMRKWLVWDEQRWRVDDLNVMRQRAKQMARTVYLQAGIRQNALLEKHARASEMSRAITNALCEAATVKGIPISAAELDQHPFLLNCPNGIVNLRDGQLLPHGREFLITKLCPVEFDPDAKCRLFLDFLYWAMGAANPDAELSEQTLRLVGFLQRAFGYAITGDVSERSLFVFHGGGKNGKTTLLSLFRDLLGKDYSGQLVIDTVMSSKNQDATTRADLADLRGLRFVGTSEVEKEHKLNSAKIKYITAGMSEIKSCRKYENPIEFTATHKLLMDCNYRPVVRDVDDAIWDRLKLIPFSMRIEEKERDAALPEKLRTELRGILAWTVRGAMAWSKEGLGTPPEVTDAGEEWREHDDPIAEFLEDCCEIEPSPIKPGEGIFVKSTDLSAAYEWWAKTNREKYPLNREALNERLISKGLVYYRSRRIDGKQSRTWEGVELKIDVVTAIRQKSGPSNGHWQPDEPPEGKIYT